MSPIFQHCRAWAKEPVDPAPVQEKCGYPQSGFPGPYSTYVPNHAASADLMIGFSPRPPSGLTLEQRKEWKCFDIDTGQELEINWDEVNRVPFGWRLQYEGFKPNNYVEINPPGSSFSGPASPRSGD